MNLRLLTGGGCGAGEFCSADSMRPHTLMASLAEALAYAAGMPCEGPPVAPAPGSAYWVRVLSGQVLAAAVGAQPIQRDHIHGDDRQGPQRVGGDEEHLVNGVEPDHGDREPACQLVAQ